MIMKRMTINDKMSQGTLKKNALINHKMILKKGKKQNLHQVELIFLIKSKEVNMMAPVADFILRPTLES